MPEIPPEPADDSRSKLLTGDLRQTVFLLALPVLCEQFLSFCVGFYDTFLSGRIGSQATSAIGLAAYVSWLASMLFALVGTGTTALVSRHWGAGEFDDARRITNRSIALAAVLGTAVYGLIFFAAPLFAHLLDMGEETRRIVVRYLRVDGFGHIFTCFSLIGAAALRGAGDMRSPMFILGLVSILNVILSSAFVYGIGPLPAWGINGTVIPKLGIDGIVLGTVLARSAGGTLMLIALSRGISGLKLSRRELKLKGNSVSRILKIGRPAAAEGMMIWAGQFVFLIIISHLGQGKFQTATFAAHVIGIQVEAITYLPAVAWGCAAATMIGQSLGAQNRDRAVQAGHAAVIQCTLLTVAIGTVFFFGAPTIYHFMHRDELVHQIGIPAFRMLAFFQPPLAISIVYVFALRGAGDTRYPMLINTIGVYAIRVPLGYFCGITLELGLVGAWLGMCGDIAVRAVLVWLRFVRQRWLEIRV